MEIIWNRITASDWDRALPPQAAALQQSGRYGAIVALNGARVAWAEVCLNGHRVGLVQVVLRRVLGVTVGLVSRGPIWTEPVSAPVQARALRALRRGMPGAGPRVLLVTPEAGEHGLPLYSPAHMAELELTQDPQVMRRAMHGKWRNRLVKAEASGLQIRKSRRPKDLDWLLEAERQNRREKGYGGLPPWFVTRWAEAYPEGFLILTAHMGQGPVAAMLFLDHAPGVTYQIGWTSGAGRVFSAHHLLLWTAMTEFAALGRGRLDLGVLDTDTAPGLARFKLGSGAKMRRLGHTGLLLAGLDRLPLSHRLHPNTV